MNAKYISIIKVWFVLVGSAVAFGQEKAKEVDAEHIVLTGVANVAPDYQTGGPLELKTKSFVLRFSAEAKPVSFKLLPTGKELLDTSKPSDGFYLECRSGKVFFTKLTRRPDGLFVVKTVNETQRVIFSVKEAEKYLVIEIKELYGIPAASDFTMHFGMHADASVRVMSLDFMTAGNANLPVNWYWIWHRHPEDPLGGFALYHKESDEDEDDTILRVWVNEGLPHPQVPGEWNLARARQWVKDWMTEFSDTSVLWYAFPKSEQELYELLPYLEKARLKEVHLMPWTWYSGKHHCWVNEKFFSKGKDGLRAYAEALGAKGMRLTLHYNFCEIPFDDPVFVGTKPDEGLGSWGRGKLLKEVGKDDTTLLFEPAPGTELPFCVDPYWYLCNPPALDVVGYFNFFRVGDEVVKVGEFENTGTKAWVLKDCTRGLGSTLRAGHAAETGMRGLVAMFGICFLPEPNSPLFRRMTQELADLVNGCHLSHVEYDGVNPAYWGNSEWMYRKYLGQFYGAVNRPITFGSGYGRAKPFGYFEYQLNAVKKMQDHELGPRGDQGARIRTDHPSRPATTVDEAQFRLSQPTAFNNHSFNLFFSVHYPSEWREYGRFEEVCDLVADWKAASKLMDNTQRERIRSTLYPPNERGYQSDTIWRLRKGNGEYRIYPGKNPLTRKTGDVRWGCAGGELGYVVPQQYIKPGEELLLENPYAAQPPQFSLRVMSAVEYNDPENIALQPPCAEVKNQSEMRVSAEAEALVLAADNPQGTELVNRQPESLLPYWERKVDLSAHRTVGMWVTGDKSGAVLILRLPMKHDYAVLLDFEGKRYFEIPNGEAYWADAAWGGPQNSEAGRFSYQTDWFKLGFGKIPPRTSAKAKVEGLKALKERPSELKNPTVRVEQCSLTIEGTVKTGEYLEYVGGDDASVYDKNWNRLRQLPVRRREYVMPTGWHKLSVVSESSLARPWLSVRFITEGEPLVVRGSR